MIAYDKTLLANTFFLEGAQTLCDGGFITSEQLAAAHSKTPTLKTHNNLLVRIGFFVLGTLLYSSVVGAASLFVFAILSERYEWALWLYAVVGLAGSEFFARQNFFAHGLDDAFILGFVTLVATAVGMNTESATAAFVALAITGVFASIRYVHTLSTVLGMVGVAGFFACLAFDLELFSKLYVPFVGLLLGIALYASYYVVRAKDGMLFYKNVLCSVQVFALVLAYVSVNYFVVRELSVDLLGLAVLPGQDIPFAWVFYVLTFGLPIGYLWYGVKTKNKPLLWLGCLALVASVLTIRHYYGMLRPDAALILAGVLLFALAYGLIRKLRHKESGITYEPDRHSNKNTMLYAQAVIVNAQINVQPVANDTGGMPFGGGGFSGGGSSETY
ncbi:hypothetical protein [Flavobacterium caeni]|uniref:DUF2157 domain-containing protein n=1 Tax=Flavobacterium caeni TaxID=490189 RepID=A0A1G5JES2_9FLAO|nr:hypothetical protein [Flavobacterium caeni]SCY86410.1 hypothetical protein SAMN02927903_02673 [Flavobacterium caeni]